MTTEDQSTQSIDVVRALGALIPRYQQWSSARIPTDGLSAARMRILVFLGTQGSAPMRALKEWCGTSATNITGLVDGLEAEGLVTRKVDPNDRRVTLITLTPEGDKRSRTDWGIYESRCAATFDSLSPEERTLLVQSLNKLYNLLTE
jgi:DNA-binding MarR family transcriptional regulator